MESPPPRTSTCHIVAMPFPARGHINPMINICNQLISNNTAIRVTFVLTQEWLSLLSSEPKPHNNLQLRSIPNVLPSELTRANHHLAFMEAVMTEMEAPFEDLLRHLDPLPTVIACDTLLPWLVGVGVRRNIPVASFWHMSASFYSLLHHHQLLVQNGHYPLNLSENVDKRVDYIPGISPTRLVDFPLNDGSYKSNRNMELVLQGIQCVPKTQYLVLTSIYELEPQAIDSLKSELSLPIYTVGPAIPYFNLQENNDNITSHSSYYLQWLDSQPNGSVLYISQGSVFSVPKSQIDEIAVGIRESGVRFLWVARGEAERLKGVCGNLGLVVAWCDQLRVLCHPAIGGFWSHCGWNSTKEGVFSGVPFLTFPIVWDQLLDSKMVVEDWKVGWSVKEGVVEGNGLVTRDEIARVVRRFMDLDSDIGRGIRERAKKLRQVCQLAIADGGSTMRDLDDFVRNIMQLV